MKKRLLPLCFLLLASLKGYAQLEHIVRGDCTPVLETEGSAANRAQQPRHLPAINKNWDADKVYHQLVILVSFSDLDFKMENPRDTYDDIFNKEGYNQRNGAGCVADYFRSQSNGLVNMHFEVYGPIKVETKAQPYDNPTDKTRNYGQTIMSGATKQFIADNPDIDLSIYDWNGDGAIEQVIYVFAGFSGNQNVSTSYGYVWPNTSTISPITTPQGITISNYTASCELWSNGVSCGIGTICHEFTHSLGLPDIYPTNSDGDYSVVDEWDLMDGGNFINYGWCPPNYSALEKILMGWLTPVELTEPTHIDGMKPCADGGEVYLVRNTKNEYYLLENRQQSGWDLGIPGRGLAIFHVNYNASKWSSNTVNATKNAYRYDLVHADNMDYNTWYDYIIAEGSNNPYVNKPRLNSRILSTSPYPLRTADPTPTVNSELTDTSVPAAVVYNENAEGKRLMSKPITNITQNPDGTIAFDFMGGNNDGIVTLTNTAPQTHQVYNLMGRAVHRTLPFQLLIVKQPDGSTKKVMK